LDGNQLQEIPKEIGNLLLLERLDISNNQLSEIPDIWGALKKLYYLNISDNPIIEILEVLYEMDTITLIIHGKQSL
jgi:Leucine-rich repeat (LRR) protein